MLKRTLLIFLGLILLFSNACIDFGSYDGVASFFGANPLPFVSGQIKAVLIADKYQDAYIQGISVSQDDIEIIFIHNIFLGICYISKSF